MILLDDSMGDVVGNVQDRLGLLPFLQLAQLDQAAHQRACRVVQRYQLLIIGEHCSHIQFHLIFLPFWPNNIYRVVWIAMQCIVQRSSPAVYVHVRLWFALHVVKFTSSYTCHGNLCHIHNFQNLWALYKTFFQLGWIVKRLLCSSIFLNVNARSQDLKLVNTKNNWVMVVFKYTHSTIWKRENAWNVLGSRIPRLLSHPHAVSARSLYFSPAPNLQETF